MTSHVRFPSSLLALVAGLWLAGCGSPAGPSESPTEPGREGRGATIQGTVVTAGSASSHPSAQALSSAGGIRITIVGTSLSTTADSSGRFTLTGVPPGTVTLRFQGPGIDARIEISGLSEGSTITITVEVSGSKATIITRSGDDDDEDDEVEFEGRIESITPPTLRVAGRTVVTDPSTKFSGEGKVKSLADLKVGMRVEVEGTAQADGSVLARKIKVEDDDLEDDEVEFEGRIESITPPTLRVAGRTVLTDGNTKFSGEGKVKSLADLKVGMRVEVEGTAQADGSVLAQKIKVEDDDDDDEDDDDDDS